MSRRLLPPLAPLVLGALILGSCAGQVQVVPQPARPVPVPAPTPTPTPAPPVRTSADWRDWDVAPGRWVYRQDARGSIALFGRTGMDADFTLRCDRERQRLYLSRRADAGGSMTIRTSSTMRALNTLPTGATPAYAAAELGTRDSLVDAIGYSRGKFVVEGPALPPLVLPAHAELLRVAEDCR